MDSMDYFLLKLRMWAFYSFRWIEISILTGLVGVAMLPGAVYAANNTGRSEVRILDDEYSSQSVGENASITTISDDSSNQTNTKVSSTSSTSNSSSSSNRKVTKKQTTSINSNKKAKTKTASSDSATQNVVGGTTSSSDSSRNSNDEYVFDERLILGSAGIVGKAKFNEVGSVVPGNYQVDLYINNTYSDRKDVNFRYFQQTSRVEPCFDKQYLEDKNVIKMDDEAIDCVPLAQRVKGATYRYDGSKLRLDLYIPQAALKNIPKGYVDPKNWDAGEPIAFASYNMSHNYASSSDSNNAYLGLSSGINLGLWRIRQQSSYTYSDSSGSRWRSIRAYVQRAIPAIESEVTLGDSYTSGVLLSSLAYRGVRLASDERMFPVSQQGYAPVVRGTARTNATVVVKQNGVIIYQTTVAAGAFEISDITPASRGGDLDVEIQESDGQVSSFSVPFSSVPESLRQGRTRYSASVGYLRHTTGNDDKDWFADFVYQYGMNSSFTLNTGARVGKNYYSFVLGTAYSSFIGALGANVTYSEAKMPDGSDESGWMTNLSYSRTIQATGTTVALAGYRYSTKGYREFSDVVGLRRAYETGTTWTSSTYLQRARLEISMNQSLDRWGAFYISASKQYYRNGRKSNTQLQTGYSNSYKQLSYTLSYAKTYNNTEGRNEDTYSLSMSLPLGSSPYAPMMALGSTRSDDNIYNTQLSISGLLDEANTLSYSLNMNHDSEDDRVTWGTTMNKRFSVLTVNANYNRNANNWSGGYGLRGALAIHSGGITFGNYVNDTFALVEAKGAAGATVSGGRVEIDRFGYAIVPSLSPYRYNTITINAENMSSNVELKDSQRMVAPYAGAMVKVKFDTIIGFPLLIQSTDDNNEILPLGAEVYNEDNAVIGMVGQAGQIYVRTDKNKGKLYVKWGTESYEQCTIDYSFDSSQVQDFYQTTGVCR